jgi:hypothetical protein
MAMGQRVGPDVTTALLGKGKVVQLQSGTSWTDKD